MSIRIASAADHSSLARLRWDHKAEDRDIPAHASFDQFAEAYRAQLAAHDRVGNTIHWIAETGCSAIGAVTIRSVDKEISPGRPLTRWGYLTNVYVEPACRNGGIGAALIQNAVAWAKAERLELLIVWPSEPSLGLYRRAGFTGTEPPLEMLLDD